MGECSRVLEMSAENFARKKMQSFWILFRLAKCATTLRTEREEQPRREREWSPSMLLSCLGIDELPQDDDYDDDDEGVISD